VEEAASAEAIMGLHAAILHVAWLLLLECSLCRKTTESITEYFGLNLLAG
jgi:hypothetical protein